MASVKGWGLALPLAAALASAAGAVTLRPDPPEASEPGDPAGAAPLAPEAAHIELLAVPEPASAGLAALGLTLLALASRRPRSAPRGDAEDPA